MDRIQKSQRRGAHTLVLTSRDLALLAFVAANRAVPVDVLAARYFDVDPVTHERSHKPARACKRRLQMLAGAGYLWLTRFYDNDDADEVAMLGPGAAGITGARPGRNRVAPRKRAHHVRTLEAVAQLERDVRARGGQVVRTRLEHELRREQQGGRFTQRGDAFVPVPDAVCTIELPQARGRRRLEVAVEYVTSKYTSADIAAKHGAFRDHYDGVVWRADRARTAARVRNITGTSCLTIK